MTIAARHLTKDDLDSVVAIDAGHMGLARRPFFEHRLAAALAEPEMHVQFGVSGEGGLAGYVLARVMDGEFGRPETALRISAIGVRDGTQGHGVGTALMDALTATAAKRDIQELRTTAAWNDHPMLRFLDHARFSLARNRIVDCPVHLGRLTKADDDDELERDRADVCTMSEADLPGIVRVDQQLTGRDRTAYVRRKIAGALRDSGGLVSLVAKDDGAVVGYLAARVDLGEAGRTEPVAVLDTLGVDPRFAGKGVGHALLSQLFANLSALHVEKVETVVAPEDFKLLGFLYDVGFSPSQRLAFVKRVA